MTTATIKMRRPHSDVQRQMVTHPGSVAAFCGRRFGKTDGYVQRLYYWMQRNPGLYWWVGLTWRSASMKRAWRETTRIAREVLQHLGLKEREHINRSNYEIRIPGLGEIWFRTADNPTSLAGEGIEGAVVDEFSLMREVVWVEYLEATLLDYDGWAAFSGVPKGNNWAANLWRSAREREGWLQLHATTYNNPYIDHRLIDEIKDNVTERFFNQEYLASIESDAGAVFRSVMRAATAEMLDEPEESGQYVMGVDWGKHNDFTVLTLVDVDAGKVVALDRFNQIDYHVQLGRLRAMYDKFQPFQIIAERNAMGEPLIEQLWRDDLPVRAFKTTNATKAAAIEALALAFEQSEIEIPNDPVLIAELQAFGMTRLPSGMVRYEAPSGMHDDCVISLALAWQGVVNRPWLL